MAKGPILIGSGVSLNNISNYKSADGLIIGSNFKVDGNWENVVAEDKVSDFMMKLEEIQKQKN